MEPLDVNVKTLSGEILQLQIIPKEGYTESAIITHQLARIDSKLYPLDRTCVFHVSSNLYGLLVLPTISVRLQHWSKQFESKSGTYRFEMSPSSYEQRDEPDRPGTDHECSMYHYGLPHITTVVVFTEIDESSQTMQTKYCVQHNLSNYSTGCCDGVYKDDQSDVEATLIRCRHCVERNGRAYYLTDEARATILRLIRLYP